MLESVAAKGLTFDQCKEILRKGTSHPTRPGIESSINFILLIDIKLDPGFKDFYSWCKANDVPVIIVSR